jgi:hypothetical protein
VDQEADPFEEVSPHEGGIAASNQRFRFESGAFRVGARRWS